MNAPRLNQGNHPHSRHIALQFAAVLAVLGVTWPCYLFLGKPLPWLDVSVLIGGVALLFATLTRQFWWWKTIHAVFAPAAFALLKLQIRPEWYLLAFAILFLFYRGALSGQIPLYFSNRRSAAALIHYFSDNPPARIIDLGAGIGSMVCPLAESLKSARVKGVENAYLPWLIGRLRTARLANCRWSLGDFWNEPLADYDVVYAFLSPAPMSDLWLKIKREMQPGTLFISNSFQVPELEASFVIEVADTRETHLFCYRV